MRHHHSIVAAVPVSPASPENAINVCLFSDLVLSSDAFRMVAPRIAALDAAMMVKSLPVMPSKTSLHAGQLGYNLHRTRPMRRTFWLIVL